MFTGLFCRRPKLFCWTSLANCSTKFFHTCHDCRCSEDLQFYTIFNGFTVDEGHKNNTNHNLLGLLSCKVFSDQDEI